VKEITGPVNSPFRINIDASGRMLWSPESPYLYNLTATLVATVEATTSTTSHTSTAATSTTIDSTTSTTSTTIDAVGSYFGLRSVSLGTDAAGVTRPLINGQFRFLNGFLDQSWWSDGVYTAPGDAALYSDLHTAKVTFGANMLRLHQKVNPERWYFY
jgi:beta-galactosidase/beta-glucuronidase